MSFFGRKKKKKKKPQPKPESVPLGTGLADRAKEDIIKQKKKLENLLKEVGG